VDLTGDFAMYSQATKMIEKISSTIVTILTKRRKKKGGGGVAKMALAHFSVF
jgi:hypothetical protein